MQTPPRPNADRLAQAVAALAVTADACRALLDSLDGPTVYEQLCSERGEP